jgi:hypothetical protein
MDIAKAIVLIEERIGNALPIDYRAFLHEHNEDQYFEQWFAVSDGLSEPRRLPINLLYSAVCEPDESSDVLQNYDSLMTRPVGYGLMPTTALPIGDSVEDIYILLYVAGPQVGQVWIKDLSYLDRGEQDTPEAGLYFVAESFSHFLNSLRDEET